MSHLLPRLSLQFEEGRPENAPNRGSNNFDNDRRRKSNTVAATSAWVRARAGLMDDPVPVLELVHVIHPCAWRSIPVTIRGARMDSLFGMATKPFETCAVILSLCW